MTQLKSKFSFLQLIVALLLVSFILGVSIICYLISIQEIKEGIVFYKTPIWVSPIFGLLGLYYAYYFLKTFKSYFFDEKGIYVSNLFKKEFFSWNLISEINLVGKEIESFLWISLFEDAISINLESKKQLVLFSKYYRNMPEIRRFLYSHNSKLIDRETSVNDYLSLEMPKKIIKDNSIYKIYSGYHLLTFYGLTIYVLMIFLFTIIKGLYLNNGFFGFLVGTLFFLTPILLLSRQMCYFKMNKDFLVVKNHIWFWKNKKLQINNIRLIYLESPYKKSHSLRVVNKDFKMFLFSATSLKEVHWKILRKDLRNRKIKVVDELFYE